MLIGPMPRNGCPLLSHIVTRYPAKAVYQECLRGNVFIELLPISGLIRYNLLNVCIHVCVYNFRSVCVIPVNTEVLILIVNSLRRPLKFSFLTSLIVISQQ
jgi:hypothetical protein